MSNSETLEFNNKTFISFRTKHSATLLIGEQLLHDLQTRLQEKKVNMNKYLYVLIQQFPYFQKTSEMPISQNLTTAYQKKGQSLHRLNFKVEPIIWHSLKSIARAHGISICLAFITLFLLDLQEKEGVPTIPADRPRHIYYRGIEFRENTNTKTGENKRILRIFHGISTFQSLLEHLMAEWRTDTP